MIYGGQGMDEAKIAIEDLKVSKEMVTLMGLEKGKPTLKITLPNKVALIKFKATEEEYEQFQTTGNISLNIIGKCNANEWNGYVTPQIIIEDYEITGQSLYNF